MRRPQAGRRRGPIRPGAERRPGLLRPRAGRRRGSIRLDALLGPGRAGTTRRAAILGMVVIALAVSAALPVREFVSQRGRITELAQLQVVEQQRVAALEQRKKQLADPDYVSREIRERLQLVKPDESAYVLLAPPSPPPPAPGQAAPAPGGPDAPWYARFYGSFGAADRPAP